MHQATLTDTDGDRLIVHGTPETLFLTVSSEDGTLTAGGFTRAQLDDLLDAVAPAGSDTRTRSLRNDLHYWQTRAEKAEKERNKARGALRTHLEDAAELPAGQRRPITADDIESVLHSILPLSTEHLGPDDIADIASDLYTALTEPPRPEGAEELEDHIAGMDVHLTPETVHSYANFLAERGVRVVGEEQP